MKKSQGKQKEVVYYQDPDLDKAFKDYIADRKEAKKDLTSRAIKEHMEELKELAGEDTELGIKIIKQSILKSWTGFFKLEEKNKPKQVFQGNQPTRVTGNRFLNFEQRNDNEEDLDSLICKKMNGKLKGEGKKND